PAEELLAGVHVLRTGRGAREDVELDPEAVEGGLDDRAPARDVLRVGHVLLLGVDRDRHAVLVRAAHEQHLLALHAQRAHVHVGRQVGPGDVPEVHRAVGVGERAGDEIADQADGPRSQVRWIRTRLRAYTTTPVDWPRMPTMSLRQMKYTSSISPPNRLP